MMRFKSHHNGASNPPAIYGWMRASFTGATLPYLQSSTASAALNFRNLFNVNYFEVSDTALPVAYGDPFTVQGTISWQF
jgi:outer membrane receptor for ferric coprogen and ferric-rhodotorulic acid